MTLELDFTNKTIKVKGTVKVSELMSKLKEHNIDEDWNLEMDTKIETRDNFYPTYPQSPTYPQWWETQPYYNNTTPHQFDVYSIGTDPNDESTTGSYIKTSLTATFGDIWSRIQA